MLPAFIIPFWWGFLWICFVFWGGGQQYNVCIFLAHPHIFDTQEFILLTTVLSLIPVCSVVCIWRWARKEGNILFNDALNTFHLWLYGVGHNYGKGPFR